VVDVLTPEQRRLNMSRIRGGDTKPEMIVRRLVHSFGYRYRLHVRALPGSPDLVLSARRKVIFVHGCFWHRHSCRLGRPQPKTRAAFWRTKLRRNVERDRQSRRALGRAGWRTLVIWQCQTRTPDRLQRLLRRFLAA
jgi:DNA mismatch endonuclease (patch repair protein)